MSSFEDLVTGPGRGFSANLPPRPEFSPADIKGHIAEARQLRTIGTGQPIKASWLCLETLDIYRRHGLPVDLDFVEALKVLGLCYTDDIKRGNLSYLRPATEAIEELGDLGGVPDAGSIHARSQRDRVWDPGDSLRAWKVRLDAVPRAAKGETEVVLTTAGTRVALVRIPRAALPAEGGEHGCFEPAGIAGAKILLEEGVRLQARFERLYLQGILGMSQALRVERSTEGRPNPVQLEGELAYLVDAAWWFHLATLVAREVPREPEEAFRKARAKSSMLIRRLDTGKHFQMATLHSLDLLE